MKMNQWDDESKKTFDDKINQINVPQNNVTSSSKVNDCSNRNFSLFQNFTTHDKNNANKYMDKNSGESSCSKALLSLQIEESCKLLEESKKWLADSIDITFCKKFSTTKEFQDQTEDDNDLGSEFIKKSTPNPLDNRPLENDLQLLDLDDELSDLSDNNKYTTNDENSVINFNDLADEIKLYVFSFFTRRELCRYVAPVCMTWFQLAKDLSFWTMIYKSDFSDVTSDLLIDVILSWCGNLTYLELEDRSDITVDGFEKIFRNCSMLKYLSLKLCKQVDNDILQLIPTHCTYLTGIDLEGCSNLTDKSFYYFVGLSLEKISVAHCNQISDDGGKFLVRNFQNLLCVNFDGIQWMTDDFVKELVLKHSNTLEEVLLDGENITDTSFELLSTCKNLRILGLSFCQSLTHRTINLVANCTNLQSLKLRKGTDFTNESLLRYFQGISEEQGVKFKSLNLAECAEITDECLFHLSKKCPNLEHVDLSWCCDISDNGIAFVINSCHQLKELYLVGLYGLYGAPFEHVVRMNPHLCFLDLSHCNQIKDEIILKLVSCMPNLVAKDYYGDFVVNKHSRKKIE